MATVKQYVYVINHLKPSDNYISNSAFCIHGFCMILNLNRDYFLEQR
jgi:hypothetical protein